MAFFLDAIFFEIGKAEIFIEFFGKEFAWSNIKTVSWNLNIYDCDKIISMLVMFIVVCWLFLFTLFFFKLGRQKFAVNFLRFQEKSLSRIQHREDKKNSKLCQNFQNLDDVGCGICGRLFLVFRFEFLF